jgi:hypothetical protein
LIGRVSATLLLCAGMTIGQDKPGEPAFNDVFYGLAAGKLIDLERQAATIHGKAKYGGFGGIKVASQFSPAKSPIRVTGDGAFIVRSAMAAMAVDPNSIYVLRVLAKRGSKRELVMVESHGPLALGGTDSRLAEGVVPVHFERYGDNSLRITSEKPLPAGEYALSKRAGLVDVFCFGVD